jgi:hypothetical protein
VLKFLAIIHTIIMLSTLVNGWVVAEIQKSLPKSSTKTASTTLAEEEDTHAKIVFIGQSVSNSKPFEKNPIHPSISDESFPIICSPSGTKIPPEGLF